MFVIQSMCSWLLPAATMNCQQIEPLKKKKCVQNSKALQSLNWVQLPLKMRSTVKWLRWFDMCMRKTSEVLAWRRQSRPIWKHKWSVFLSENKKSTTRDGLDDYANTKKKRTKTNQKKTYQLLVSRFLKHLDKKAVLQTIGYQHISKVPQCLLVEA